MGKSLKEAAAEAKAKAPQPVTAGTPTVEQPKAAAPVVVIDKAKAGAVTVTATYAGESKGGKRRFEYMGTEGKVFLYLERTDASPVTVTIS